MVCNYNVEHSFLVVIVLHTVLLNLLEFYSTIPFPTDGENGKADRAKLVNIAVESYSRSVCAKWLNCIVVYADTHYKNHLTSKLYKPTFHN